MFDLGRASGVIMINVGPALASYEKVQAEHAATMKTMGDAGQAAKRVGVGLLAVGAAALYGFGKAVEEAAKFQKSLSYFGAVTGATKQQIAAIGDEAIKVDRVTGVGIQNVADAFVELGKAGVGTKEIIAGVGQATVDLARAADISASQAATTMVNITRTFHIAAKNAGEVADVLAGAANASTISIEDLATSIKFAGSSAAALHIPFREVADSLAYLGNMGIRGSTAGTSLRMILVSLAGRTGPATAELKQLGIITREGSNAFFDAAGNAKSMAQIAQVLKNHTKDLSSEQRVMALNQIFGNRAMSSAIILARGGAAAINAMDKQVGAVTAYQVMQARMDNLSGAFQRFKVAIQIAAIQLGGSFLRPLQTVVEWVTRAITAFGNLPKGLLTALGVITLLIGVLGTLGGSFILVIAFAARFIRALTELRAIMISVGELKVFQGLSTGMAGLSAGMGPIGIGFAALAVAAVGAFTLITRSERAARKEVDDYAQSLKDSASDIQVVVNKEMALQAALARRVAILKQQRPLESFTPTVVAGSTGSKGGGSTAGLPKSTAENAAALKVLQTAFINNDAAVQEYRKQIGMTQGQLTTMRGNVSNLSNVYGINASKVQEIASANNIDLKQSLGVVGPEFAQVAQAAMTTHHPLAQAMTDMEGVGQATSSVVDDVQGLTGAFDSLVGAVLNADDAHIAFKDDIDALDKALKKSHGSMKLSGKTSRDARAAFNSAAASATTWAEKEAALPHGLDKATAALKNEIRALKAHSDGSEHAQAVIRNMERVLGTLPATAKKASDGVKKGAQEINQHADELRMAGVHVATTASNAAKKGASDAVEAGREWSQGYASGMTSQIAAVVAAAIAIAAAATGAARSHKGQDSGSPSKKAHKVGLEWGDGYAGGIVASYAVVERAARGAASKALAVARREVLRGIARAVRPEETDPKKLAADLKQSYLHAVRLRMESNKADAHTKRRNQRVRELQHVDHKHVESLLRRARAAKSVDAAEKLMNRHALDKTKVQAAERYAKTLQNEADHAKGNKKALEARAKAAQAYADKVSKNYDKLEKHAEHLQQKAQKASDKADQLAANAASRAQDIARSLVDSAQSAADDLIASIQSFEQDIASGIRGQDTIGSIWDELTASGRATIGNLQGSLGEVKSQVKDFADELTKLASMGASQDLISQIAAMGPATGGALASQLIAAGKPAISSLNDTLGSIDSIANKASASLGDSFFGAGVNAMEQFIRGLEKKFPELIKALDPILKDLSSLGFDDPTDPGGHKKKHHHKHHHKAYNPFSNPWDWNRSLAASDIVAGKSSSSMTIPGAGTKAGGDVYITFGPTYNPKPETTSTTHARRMRTLAQIGPWRG